MFPMEGGNSSSTLVPMREQENAYKGMFFSRRARIRACTRKGGKIGPKQEKGCFSKIWEKTREKGPFCQFWLRTLNVYCK